jgi:hypothetical protein
MVVIYNDGLHDTHIKLASLVDLHKIETMTCGSLNQDKTKTNQQTHILIVCLLDKMTLAD